MTGTLRPAANSTRMQGLATEGSGSGAAARCFPAASAAPRRTCTVLPVVVRGWKELTMVCRSSMYGRMPLACIRTDGAQREVSKSVTRRSRLPTSSLQRRLELSSRDTRWHATQYVFTHLHKAPAQRYESSHQANTTRDNPSPERSPRAPAPAACPAGREATRAAPHRLGTTASCAGPLPQGRRGRGQKRAVELPDI